MKVLLIIPTYNEGEGIVSLIAKIKQARSDIDYVVINDGSKDNTDELLKAHNINHVTLVKNLGIGGAVQTGL
ncbi:glycosyltransferase [Erysipelothrix sp. D19-032]